VIIEKVQEKQKKIVMDSKFFEMQDEILKKAEKRNNSPLKQKCSELVVRSPVADEVCSQLINSTQHQLRNRSVAKRDIKEE
jgi:hypothetical protein